MTACTAGRLRPSTGTIMMRLARGTYPLPTFAQVCIFGPKGMRQPQEKIQKAESERWEWYLPIFSKRIY